MTAADSAAVAAAVEKNGRFTTRDLASAQAYLILPLGPFLTDLGARTILSYSCRRRKKLVSRQRHPADCRPALFA